MLILCSLYSSSPQSIRGYVDEWIHKLGDWAREERPGERFVVLGNVLQHPVNVGVQYYKILLSFNGRRVAGLRALAAAVDACRDPWMRFELTDGRICVMDAEHAHAATRQLMEQFGIKSDRRLKG